MNSNKFNPPIPDSGGATNHDSVPFEERRKQRAQKAQRSSSVDDSAHAPSSFAPKPQHQRGVSWGGVSMEEFTQVDDSIPDSLSAEEAYEAAEAALAQRNDQVVGGGGGGSRMANGKKVSEAGKIVLEDLMQIHPLETEAEVHILRALEKRENATEGQDIITGEVALLGNVPLGAEGIFTSPPSDADTNSFSDQPSGTRARGLSMGTYYDNDGDSVPPPSNFTTPLVDMVWSSSEGGSDADAAMAGTRHSNNTTRHRRHKTMEQTLFSLTNAMDDLNRHNRPRAMTADDEDPTRKPPSQRPEPQSSADAFSQNVSLLFRPVVMSPQPPPGVETEPLLVVANNDIDTTTSHDVEAGGLEHPLVHEAVPGPENDGSSAEVHSATLPSPGRSVRARKHWTQLKEAIIQDGPAAAANPLSVDGMTGAAAPPMTTIQEDLTMVDGCGDMDNEGGVPTTAGDTKKISGLRKRLQWLRAKFRFVSDVDGFLQPRRRSIWIFIKTMLWLMLPSIGIAFVLFYLFDNPTTGRVDRNSDESQMVDPKKASVSWWILFIAVRQVITFSLARFMESFVVDFICLERRWSLACFGPTLTLLSKSFLSVLFLSGLCWARRPPFLTLFCLGMTLLVVQSKGWPCIGFFWAIFDLALMYGDHAFASHWGYWQDWLDIFSESNPSGSVVASDTYLRIILMVLGVSIAVAIKRLLIGFYQGRKIFVDYAEDLARTMKKILLVSQVAALAAQLERERILAGDDHEAPNVKASRVGIDEMTAKEVLESKLTDEDHPDARSEGSAISQATSQQKSARSLLISENDDDNKNPPGFLSRSQKERISRLLGNWEEPEVDRKGVNENISIASILQFRTSMEQLGQPFPFGFAFGRATRREECIESAQNIYLRLLAETPGETVLSFNILALVALQSDGTIVQEKIRDLVRVFRPGRSGALTLLNFCKSVDSVYKEKCLLRASVRNSQKIDKSIERIFNAVFFIVILCICLALLDFDPLALFLSLSSFALAFSFMISRASSNYFEGLLFILCHRPYDIGDRIVIHSVESETSWHGATHWIVKDIDLMKTTIVYAYTNEVATLSNGSMANSRIMNGARSPAAILYVIMRFGIDVTYGQIEVFRDALVRYVEARPRDWAKCWAFRAMAVQADKGYVEYCAILEARDGWQELDNLLFIRGQIQSFCHELSKQLKMRYMSPALPVDLRMQSSLTEAVSENERRLDEASQVIQSIIQDRRR